MAIHEPWRALDEMLTFPGEAGERLSEINASEGAAGNISAYIGWPIEVRRRFPVIEPFTLPQAVPGLAGKTFIVTGSGRRLREIIAAPAANLAALGIDEDGATARLCTSPRRAFARITSEFNSHLAVHNDQVRRSGTNFHALIHAQPLHLTYLSHVPRYRDPAFMNQHLLRWQPELIVHFPEGIGVIPFLLPGSAELMDATVAGLRQHPLVVWSKHGVMARSDASVKRACDRIEYLETAARYELMNLAHGEIADGLLPGELAAIAAAFGAS
jgi:rhamnulose-1-phosphate aldolase